MHTENQIQTNEYTVIHGDARRMIEIPDNSAHLVITSPPYWQIKDYGSREQIGYHHSYDVYINNLNLVWSECRRILHEGCRLCINIGDQYARAVDYGRYKVIPIRTEIIKFCEHIGFDYMGSIIWQKVSTTNTSGGASIMGSYPYPRNGILKLDYEFILIFKIPGKPPVVPVDIKNQSILSKEEWNTYFTGHWNFPGVRQKDHSAMFPEELPHRLIKMFSFVGDQIVDPFLGSGTTMVAASKLNRRCIGYEINNKYIPVICQRMEPDIKMRRQGKSNIDHTNLIKNMPYIFTDTIQIQKSKKEKNENYNYMKQSDYCKVKKILSPVSILLNNGIVIQLLGIQIVTEKEDETIEFLNKTITGKQVYYTKDNNHEKDLVYLYLKNRTFINAHLIKLGLAIVDMNLNFHHKKRFISYLP